MRKAGPILAAISLSMCLGLPPRKPSAASENSVGGNSSFSPSTIPDERGIVTVDIKDSDEFFQNVVRSRAPERDYSQKIEALLRQMTVEEKVGQMTQLTLAMIVNGHDQNIEIDPAKLEKAIGKYGVGSILNTYDQALTPDKWQDIITQIQTAAKKTRLGIPVIYGIDSIHGANYVQGSTLFPQETGMAATWNPELMKRAAEISAVETRAVGIPWSFSPVLDIGRQPLWSRFWETFGEDPYLAKVMGVAFVRGMEGSDVASQDHVAVSLKHYLGYSFPLNGRDRTSAWIPENYLREYFLPTFAAAVQAGAHTVMVNSGDINGVPAHANHHILTDILREELGFKGFVVSDWADIKRLAHDWRVAATEKEATRMAVMAGVDMSMVPSDYSFADLLIALVKEGAVPQSRIDEAVRRILRVKFELGLFDNPMPNAALKSKIGLAESRQTALQAAQESITVLKNTNGLLPLSKAQKVLVTGPTADSMISLNNGWTYVWQGSEPSLFPKDRPTIRQAIEVTGKPVVIVLVEGRPRIINRIVDKPGAIVMAYNPGNEGGLAVADALFGDINPSGKLPFTYPRAVNGLVTYDHRAFETEGQHSVIRPQFEFGYGLSYTSFGYSDLRLSKKTISGDDELSVSVTVTNTGRRAGKEIAQLYISDLVASIAPAVKRLKRFAKISLQPGQRRILNFKLRREDLSFIGIDNKPVAEPGNFDVMIGGLRERFTLK